MNLIEIAQLTENQAREYLESIRWDDGAICPHCDSKEVTKLCGKSTRLGVHKCKNKDCRKQFTVTVGTIFEGSHIPLKKWLLAYHLMCSSKKGISALQLQRNLELGSYQTAWHMAHRIRFAMGKEPLKSKLKGVVEVDETYIGGKRKNKHKNKQIEGDQGRSTKSKTPVIALVERNGNVIAKPLKRVGANELKGAIREIVTKESTIMTDEWSSYKGIGKEFDGGHQIVEHGAGEYVKGNASTNTVESYFSLLKRGVMGTFYHVSKKHLPRYCDEFSFRWNNRKYDDEQRTTEALKGMVGKRLMYKQPIKITR